MAKLGMRAYLEQTIVWLEGQLAQSVAARMTCNPGHRPFVEDNIRHWKGALEKRRAQLNSLTEGDEHGER